MKLSEAENQGARRERYSADIRHELVQLNNLYASIVVLVEPIYVHTS